MYLCFAIGVQLQARDLLTLAPSDIIATQIGFYRIKYELDIKIDPMKPLEVIRLVIMLFFS